MTNSASNAYAPMLLQASKFAFTQGNVGIGTSSPGSSLTIVTPAASDTIPTLGSNGGKFALLNTTYGLIAGMNNTSGNAYIQVQRIDGTATAYSLLLQPNGGNVGIGTTIPSAKLHITDSGNVMERIWSTSLTGNATIQYLNNTMNYEAGIFSDQSFGINA